MRYEKNNYLRFFAILFGALSILLMRSPLSAWAFGEERHPAKLDLAQLIKGVENTFRRLRNGSVEIDCRRESRNRSPRRWINAVGGDPARLFWA